MSWPKYTVSLLIAALLPAAGSRADDLPTAATAEQPAAVPQASQAERPDPPPPPPTPPKRFRENVEVVADEPTTSDAPSELPVRSIDVMAVAGAGENVFRTLQTLPGIARDDEFDSRIAVRGGAPDENLTVMDGVEIHNPYRLFGLTSAFNPETVRGFELYAGAFSAKYGDRLSSLLVVENRPGTESSRLEGLGRRQPDRRQRRARRTPAGPGERLVDRHRPTDLLRPRGELAARHAAAGVRRPAGARRLEAEAGHDAVLRRAAEPRADGRVLRRRPCRRAGQLRLERAQRPGGAHAARRCSGGVPCRARPRPTTSTATHSAWTRSSATSRAARTRRTTRSASGLADVELHARARRARPGAAAGARAEGRGPPARDRLRAARPADRHRLADRRRPQQQRGERLEHPGRCGAAVRARLGGQRPRAPAPGCRTAGRPPVPLSLEGGLRFDWSDVIHRSSVSPRFSSTLRLGRSPACAPPSACSRRARATRSWSSRTTSSTSRASSAARCATNAPPTPCSAWSATPPALGARVEAYWKGFERPLDRPPRERGGAPGSRLAATTSRPSWRRACPARRSSPASRRTPAVGSRGASTCSSQKRPAPGARG